MKRRSQGLGFEQLEDRTAPAVIQLSVRDAFVYEGNVGSHAMVFEVDVQGDVGFDQVVSVHYKTVPGSTYPATPGVDYDAVEGDLIIDPFNPFLAIHVPIHGDVVKEHDETLRLVLSQPSGATLTRAVARGIIFSDDRTGVGTYLPDGSSIPGSGFGTLQYAPDGRLAQVRWQENQLIYRVRQPDRTWTEEAIGVTGNGYFYNISPSDSAALLFGADGTPHVLTIAEGTAYHFIRGDTGWTAVDIAQPPTNGFPSMIAAAIGSGDVLHMLARGDGFGRTATTGDKVTLFYGTTKSGSWTWERVRNVGVPDLFIGDESTSRTVSLAVDAENFAHIAFSPLFNYKPVGRFSSSYSELHYASNRSGAWASRKVYGPPPGDSSADAGLASSIAINPINNRPGIASYYVDRAATGSPIRSYLVYHGLTAAGAWTHAVLVNKNLGYGASNGEFRGGAFTGFAPLLLFDNAGRPNIAFLDDASVHRSGYANHSTGQLRHIYHNGRTWVSRLIHKQTNSETQEMHLPVMALSANEVSFLAFRQFNVTALDFKRKLEFNYIVEISKPR